MTESTTMSCTMPRETPTTETQRARFVRLLFSGQRQRCRRSPRARMSSKFNSEPQRWLGALYLGNLEPLDEIAKCLFDRGGVCCGLSGSLLPSGQSGVVLDLE